MTDLSRLVDLALAAQQCHVFGPDLTTCVCGFGPKDRADWDRHVLAAVLAAVWPTAPHLLTADADHPEAWCHRCYGPNVVWTAPSPLWNAVMRGGSINGAEECDGIVCPRCFAELAEQRGVADTWRLTAQRVHATLELVAPSGRTWDEQTWMWAETDGRRTKVPAPSSVPPADRTSTNPARYAPASSAGQWHGPGTLLQGWTCPTCGLVSCTRQGQPDPPDCPRCNIPMDKSTGARTPAETP